MGLEPTIPVQGFPLKASVLSLGQHGPFRI